MFSIQSVSCSAKAEHPVRRGFSTLAALSLEYWIARSSRAMTSRCCLTCVYEPISRGAVRYCAAALVWQGEGPVLRCAPARSRMAERESVNPH